MTSRKDLPLTADFAANDPMFATDLVVAFLDTPASRLGLTGTYEIQRSDLFDALMLAVAL